MVKPRLGYARNVRFGNSGSAPESALERSDRTVPLLMAVVRFTTSPCLLKGFLPLSHIMLPTLLPPIMLGDQDCRDQHHRNADDDRYP